MVSKLTFTRFAICTCGSARISLSGLIYCSIIFHSLQLMLVNPSLYYFCITTWFQIIFPWLFHGWEGIFQNKLPYSVNEEIFLQSFSSDIHHMFAEEYVIGPQNIIKGCVNLYGVCTFGIKWFHDGFLVSCQSKTFRFFVSKFNVSFVGRKWLEFTTFACKSYGRDCYY